MEDGRRLRGEDGPDYGAVEDDRVPRSRGGQESSAADEGPGVDVMISWHEAFGGARSAVRLEGNEVILQKRGKMEQPKDIETNAPKQEAEAEVSTAAEGSAEETLAVARNSTKARLVFGFNSFFVDFLMFVKGADEAMMRRVKKNYRVVDRKCDAHLVWLSRALGTSPEKYGAVLRTPESCGRDVVGAAMGLSVAEGIALSESWIKEGSRSDGWMASLALQVRLLVFVARLFSELCEGEASEDLPGFLDDVFSRAVMGVGAASSGEPWDFAVRDVIDDDARAGLECVLRSADECREKGVEEGEQLGVRASEEIVDAGMLGASGASALFGGLGGLGSLGGLGGMGGMGGLAGMGGMGGFGSQGKRGRGRGGDTLEEALESLKDSSLGKIAMELSETVDKDALREELMGGDGGIEAVIKGLMTGESKGLIGDMLTRVSGVVAGKMEDGSLNLEDLMRDAGRVMGAFNGSSLKNFSV